MIYETIYKKLSQLIPNLDTINEYAKFKASGMMNLNVDILFRAEDGTIRLALSHYYKHESGDMIADPDMEIKVFPDMKMAEALTFQDCFGYRVVYPTPDKVDVKAKAELNRFLNQWLSNLIRQDYQIVAGDSE